MPLLIGLAAFFLVLGAARLRIGPAVRVQELARRAWPTVRTYVTRSPATFLYLFTVTVTAWVLATSGPGIDEALLRGHSSNLAALAQDPFRGLVQSAFWVEGAGALAVAWALGIVLAPVERWLGTARWLVVFLAGHIGTSLLVAGVIWAEVRWGVAEPGLRNVIDVGVSYGFGAVAGVVTYRLTRRAAYAYAGAVLGVLLVVLAVDQGFTALGHVIAFLVGLACRPLVLGAGPRRRAREPFYAAPRRAEPGARGAPVPVSSSRGPGKPSA